MPKILIDIEMDGHSDEEAEQLEAILEHVTDTLSATAITVSAEKYDATQMVRLSPLQAIDLVRALNQSEHVAYLDVSQYTTGIGFVTRVTGFKRNQSIVVDEDITDYSTW